jgi:hypothetical protein
MKMVHAAFAALLSSALIVLAAPADAQQQKKAEKISRQEAWSRCTAEVSKIPSDQHSQRYSAGAACMKKYGFRI